MSGSNSECAALSLSRWGISGEGAGAGGELASNNLTQREDAFFPLGAVFSIFHPALLLPFTLGLVPSLCPLPCLDLSWAELPAAGFPKGVGSFPHGNGSPVNALHRYKHISVICCTALPRSLIFNCCSCFLWASPFAAGQSGNLSD